MLALVVEHVLLLAVEIFDREAVDRELRAGRHPALHRRQRNLQQLGIEPGRRLRRLGEQDLHLLPPRVDLVVALVLVVPERREVPHLVFELADLVAQPQRGEQPLAALAERSLKRRERGDLPVELVVRRLPRVPVGEDVLEVPLEAIRDLSRSRSGGAAGASVVIS